MRPIIQVENLSKQYKLGARQAPYATLRESLTEMARSPFKNFRRSGNNGSAENTFWALKDINFE
ncbi:MAG: ABC transporter ATP-binding protein, partial [Acidobacteriota bacterium]|nr:ABC transporter ATP-binding protein [Acidobacteriota bacterium]